MQDDLTIVVPVLNEAEALRVNLPRWLSWCSAHDSRLILVDDGSTDATPTVLLDSLGHPALRVFRHRRNRGYGNAIKTGIYNTETQYVGTMDADGQHSIDDVGRLQSELVALDADLVIGSRRGPGGSGIYRGVGKAVIRWIAWALFAIRINDLNSGMKVFRTPLARDLLRHCPGSMAFSDVITLTYLSLGCMVLEVPIEVGIRRSGKSTITTMTAMETLVEILNVLLWFKPLKFFFPSAAVLFGVGVLWAIPFLRLGRGLSSISLLLILAGMMVGMLGLLAEQLAASRRGSMPDVVTTEILPPNDDRAQRP